MTQALNLGAINGHTVGRVLKEAVRRATVVISNQRMVFEAHTKPGYGGTMDDVCTSADVAAQEVYLRTFQECFPDCGVIGEEKSLSISPRPGCSAYFTVDPLDGTKAFVRRQSHGVGTMVALVDNEEVLSAYIGDINTAEVYGYRPGSTKAHRITRLDTFEELTYRKPWTPDEYVILRDPVETYSSAAQHLVRSRFKSHLVDGGSIGIWLARLWKREVTAAIIGPGWQTPWDLTPIVGISEKLGYRFYQESGDRWIPIRPRLSTKPYESLRDLLIVHENDAAAMGI